MWVDFGMVALYLVLLIGIGVRGAGKVKDVKGFTASGMKYGALTIFASLSASYIGNGVFMDRDFSNAQSVKMPHFGNNFAVEASQVIFAGGAIRTSIEKSVLEEQLAQLNYDRNELDICFLVTGYYLDLYKLKNQREVFLKNMEQTEMLIQQINRKKHREWL